jgi:hypothetical protein
MVAIVIFWPGLVTAFLDKASNIDPTKIQIEIPRSDFEGKDQGEEGTPPPDFSAPAPKK